MPRLFFLIIFLFSTPLALAAQPTYTLDKDPLRAGKKAFEEGRYADAGRYFQEAIAAGHQVSKASFGLAEVRAHEGRFREAEELYRRAVEGAGKYPEAHAAWGLLLLRQGREQEARTQISAALAEDDDLWNAQYGQARLFLLEKRHDDAKKLLERGARRKGVKEGEDLYHHGMALYWLDQGKLAEAEVEALSALALNQNQPEISLLVGQVYQAQKTPYLAIQAFETALSAPSATPSASLLDQLGHLYEQVGKPNEARDAYLKAVAADSMYAPAFRDLATVLRRGGQPEAAARAYLRYVLLEPNDIDALVSLSNACFEAHRLNESLEAAEKALALDGTRPDAKLAYVRSGLRSENKETKERALSLATTLPDSVVTAPEDRALILYQQGMLQLKHGDPKAAIPHLERAVSLDPKSTLYQLNLAVAFLQAKDNVTARAWLRRTLALDPNLAPAHLMLAQALVTADSTQSAEAEFRRTLEIEPKNAAALRGLGYCQIQRGAYADAVNSYRGATLIDSQSLVGSPQSADGWAGLGSAYLGLQKWSEAENAFKRALSIDPKNPSALRGLELLKKAGH